MSADSTISKETLINSSEGGRTVLRFAQNRPRSTINQCISENPRISVILPVWNPGPGIDRCISSLRGQTLQDIEMIFVDDRGTDDAMDKVQAAAAEDPRIRILENPENVGAGPSRNRGIEAARGEFLSFIDPDDYIAPNYFERLYAAAASAGADIAKGFCVYRKGDGTDVEQIFFLNERIRKELSERKPLFTAFTYEHFSAIYSRKLFESGDVWYGVTRRDQDTIFLLRICSKTDKIVICDDARYFYMERNNSAMHKNKADGLEDITLSFEALADFFSGSSAADEHACTYILSILGHRLSQYFTVFRKDSHLKKKYAECLERVRFSAQRLPFSGMLRNKSFSAMVLLDYGICLPDRVFALRWDNRKLSDYLDLAAAYLGFALAHPQFAAKCRRRLKILWKNLHRDMKNKKLDL